MCKISWYLEDRDFKAFTEVLRVLTKFWDIRTGIGTILVSSLVCMQNFVGFGG